MVSLIDRLASYAEYHRDQRNIATHFVGIPMILVGTQAALAKIGIGPVNAAVAATGLAARYYRALDPAYGTAMAAVLGATCAMGTAIAAMPMPLWAGATAGLLVGGWAIQFVGHAFEGRAGSRRSSTICAGCSTGRCSWPPRWRSRSACRRS
jgi:uncharacterized membrane protein YGL010W